MKEAKSEAEKIISSYKAEMEVNYQVSLAKVSIACRLQSALYRPDNNGVICMFHCS
jgi:hypothetical protein